MPDARAVTFSRSSVNGRRRSAATDVRLELLRGFALKCDGEPFDLPRAAQRVVAFLALRERPVHRLVVSGTLWIDHGPDQASASLRTALWRLNRVVAGLVTVDGSNLALAPVVDVDVQEAEHRASVLSRMPEEYSERDLFVLGETGDVLPDWYDDWVVLERERYRQVRLHALECLCRSLAASGAYADAISAGLAAVAGEPLRESGHRALIAAHIAEGNVAEALRQYEWFRGQLVTAIGIEPSPRMQMLVDRFRSP